LGLPLGFHDLVVEFSEVASDALDCLRFERGRLQSLIAHQVQLLPGVGAVVAGVLDF